MEINNTECEVLFLHEANEWVGRQRERERKCKTLDTWGEGRKENKNDNNIISSSLLMCLEAPEEMRTKLNE